jgi:hypothetical protein
LIRANLRAFQEGKRARETIIGTLTDAQLAAINERRAAHSKPLAPIVAEILFIGKHLYQSRCVRDGYTIEDVVDQIISALSPAAVFVDSPTFAALQNGTPREDRYGNKVRDRAVLECTTHHPRPELYSVTPKGDYIKPPKR